MKRYKAYRSEPKGSVLTYYEDSSLLARRSGLTVANMVASVLSGSSVSINTQAYTAANNSLAYQINFLNAGNAVVRITTTFSGTDETKVSDYHYKVLDNEMAHSDYV